MRRVEDDEDDGMDEGDEAAMPAEAATDVRHAV